MKTLEPAEVGAVLHLLRNPHGHTEDVIRLARISAADEIERLHALINTPHTKNFFQAVELEAAHQVVRHGEEHDAGKEPSDWFWLLGFLSGKALSAFIRGDQEKGMHHIISSAAALLNWHRNVTGESTLMRPGIKSPEANHVSS